MTKMWAHFQNLSLKACAGRLQAAWVGGLRSLLLAPCLLVAEEGRVLKQVEDGAERGRLSDARQIVRGDTGKWSDVAELQPAPPLARKPSGLALDAWLEELAGRAVAWGGGDEVWLLYRSRQLDDNDRLWIERIERAGNAITVTLHEAIWQGDYFKTFTYHEVGAVNLGRLPAGEYIVTWRVLPLQFRQLEKPREAQRDYVTNWPVDAQPGAGEAVVLTARFRVRE
jgi:hypothetical protein